MKKLLVIISAGILFFATGCKPAVGNGSETKEVPEVTLIERTQEQLINKDPTVRSNVVEYTYEDDGETFKTGETRTSNNTAWAVINNVEEERPILTVVAKGNGLEITKCNDTAWWYIDIHVKNVTNGIEVARLLTNFDDNQDPNPDVYFYPFVTKGDEYKIWLTKQEENYQNWGSTDNDAVYITAIGGEGDFYISSKAFSYDKATTRIVFKDLVLNIPQKISTNGWSIGGGIYDGGSWSGNNIWPHGYEFEKSSLVLNRGNYWDSYTETDQPVSNFIETKNLLWVTFRGSYEYWDYDYAKRYSFEHTFIESEIYNSKNNKTVKVEGGKKIPTVNITTGNGWFDISETENPRRAYHFGDVWTEAQFEIIDSENSENNFANTSILIRDRGNSTRWEGKTPYAIKMNEKNSVLGMKKNKRWVLMANHFDRSLIRNRFTGYLGRNIFNSAWNAKFKPVNVYINGTFIGTYDLGEQIKIGNNRVDVQSIEDYVEKPSSLTDQNGDGKVDINDTGFILEIDMRNKQRYHFYSDYYKLAFNLKDPDFDSATSVYDQQKVDEAFEYVKSKVNKVEEVLVSDDFKKNYSKYIDVNTFIDWYIINEFAKNFDGVFQTSCYMFYDPNDGKLKMGPNWDFDLALGNCNGAEDTDGHGCNYSSGWLIHGGRKGIGTDNDELKEFARELSGDEHYHAYWINRLFEDEAFKKAVKNRWMQQRVLLKNAINEKIIEYASDVKDYIPDNEEIHPRLGRESWNGPDGYSLRTQYEDEIYYLYSWCMDRYNWMNNQISGW